MKIVSPPSYLKIFAITPSNSVVVGSHRGLLVTTTALTTLVVGLQDGNDVTINNIPANQIFVLPLVVKYVKTGTTASASVYGLL